MNYITIDTSNVGLLSSLYIHDAICEKWTFEYATKQLTMELKRDDADSKMYKVIFDGIFAHHMVSCDFWGHSPYLFGMKMIEPMSSVLYKQIASEKQIAHYDSPCDEQNCIGVMIQFTSGDVLSVLCQKIMISQ